MAERSQLTTLQVINPTALPPRPSSLSAILRPNTDQKPASLGIQFWNAAILEQVVEATNTYTAAKRIASQFSSTAKVGASRRGRSRALTKYHHPYWHYATPFASSVSAFSSRRDSGQVCLPCLLRPQIRDQVQFYRSHHCKYQLFMDTRRVVNQVDGSVTACMVKFLSLR